MQKVYGIFLKKNSIGICTPFMTFHSLAGTFHLSLTVLVHYQLFFMFSFGGWFPRFHRIYSFIPLLKKLNKNI